MSFASHSNIIDFANITKSVGKSGLPNRPSDVLKVQRLLNGTTHSYFGQKFIKCDGFGGPGTEKAIKAFQRSAMGMKNPDGQVDPGGKTLAELYKSVDRSYLDQHLVAAKMNQKKAIDAHVFIQLYKQEYTSESLSGSGEQGLRRIINTIMSDADITDIRWAAYILATIYRECGPGVWQPVAEKGKGAGKDYGNEVTVTDDKDKKKTYTHVYYGRGYTQLTWVHNYEKLGKAIGYGKKLAYNPDLALDHDVAYKILTVGMRKGSFTGRAFVHHISGENKDYLGARYIINGQDHAKEIADNADRFEALLKLAMVQSPFNTVMSVLSRIGGVAQAGL